MNEPENTPLLLRVLDEHGSRLFLVLKRVTLSDGVAEDLLQELFLRLRSSIGFTRADDPAAYAARTALRLAFDWRRRRKRSVGPLDFEPSDRSPPAWAVAAGREEMERVLDALSVLSRPSREIVAWRFLDGDSYEVIAERLRKTPHQARALCHKAVLRLRRQLSISKTSSGNPVSEPTHDSIS